MHGSVSAGVFAAWLVLGALVLPSHASDAPISAPFEPGVISTAAAEVRLAISPDGRQMLWGSIGRDAPAEQQDIWERHRVGDGWSTPARVSFDTEAVEFDPAFSKDGKKVYFHSDRAGGFGGTDIYVVTRDPTSFAFGTPANAGPAINSKGDEWAPTPTRDGGLLFSSNGWGGLGRHDLGCDGTSTIRGLSLEGFPLFPRNRTMSDQSNAKHSGQFRIGGDIEVNRLGFGAMRITGKGIWGEPAHPDAARATLKKLPDVGVNFIDTADSYGPYVSENLIREVLHPYKGMLVATKGGLTRHGPDVWAPLGRPEYLRQCVLTSLHRLGVERIDLWQLHRIDAKVPRDEQFDVIKAMQSEGLIRHVGLSEVNVEEIKAAGKYFKVTTVQNLYNLGNRQSEEVLDYCDANNIGFIPWFPLAAGELAAEGSVLSKISAKLKASNGQVALAWLLKRSKVMLPIPGTGSVDHLIENVGGASIALSDEDFKALEHAAK